MSSPKPPRSPMSHPRRPPSHFRRSVSSPETKALLPRRIPPVPEVVGTCIPSSPSLSTHECPPGAIPLNMTPRYAHGFASRTTSPWSPSLPEFPALEELAQNPSKSAALEAKSGEGSSGVDFRRGLLRRGSKQSIGSLGGLNEWCMPLVVFSLVCLVSLVATLMYSIQVVEKFENEMVGRFIHLSDIHFDPLYRSTSNPSLTCRTSVSNSSDLTFGQYGCDSPLQLVRSAMKEAARVSYEPDFVLITGDTCAHNLTSTNEVLQALTQVDMEVQRAFPDPTIKILYAIGESELFPAYSGAGTANSMWLSRLAAAWNDSLSKAGDDALETFQRGGYYTAVIDANQHSSRPGQMAVIVLNTLLYSVDVSHPSTSSSDPAGQLAWLEDQLAQARHWGRSVLIAGHRPPGVKELTKGRLWRAPFEERYTDIILKHSDVVVGQLFGYLHRDQFRLMTAGNEGVDASEEGRVEGSSAAMDGERVAGRGGSAAEREGEGEATLGADFRVGRTGGTSRMQTPSAVEDAQGGLRRSLAQGKGRRSLGGMFLSRSSQARKWGWGWGWGLGAVGSTPTLEVEGSRGGMTDSGSERHVEEEEEKKDGVGTLSGGELGVPSGSWKKRQVASTGDATSAGSLILMAPSLSPMYENRPAFRVFHYDRWKRLIDYTEHTAELKEQQGRMWGEQYSATGVYGIELLDSANLAQVSSSFFTKSGALTNTFIDFCSLRAAGRHMSSLPSEVLDQMECCEECPRHMHCSVAYSTFTQYQDCSKRALP